jgi:hypothetical protein
MSNEKKKVLKMLTGFACLALIFSGWILLSRLKRLGYVDSAIGSMRVLVAAEAKFAQAHPALGYACNLSELPADEDSAEVIKTGRKNEYTFEIGGCNTEDRAQPNTKYQLTARPLAANLPAFCSDQSGIVRYDGEGSVQKCLQSGVPIG